VNRISQQNDAANDRNVPKGDGDVRAFFVFADYPLENESRTEGHLPCETDNEPDRMSCHLFSNCASEKLDYRLQHSVAPY
jgi:hypothetical protein